LPTLNIDASLESGKISPVQLTSTASANARLNAVCIVALLRATTRTPPVIPNAVAVNLGFRQTDWYDSARPGRLQ
jgi:hypothetical protein